MVHVFREDQVREEEVVAEFKGRTALERDAHEGNVTLEIRQVRLEDRGPYRCQVRIANLSREGTVILQVAGGSFFQGEGAGRWAPWLAEVDVARY